jgi:predicted SAM-dependent methyltransferase
VYCNLTRYFAGLWLALGQCHQLLRPSGLLVVAIPKFESLTRHALGNYWPHLEFPIHLHHFNRPVLEQMIRDAGFQVREVQLSYKLLNLFYAVKTMK